MQTLNLSLPLRLAERLSDDDYPVVGMEYCFLTSNNNPPTCWFVRGGVEFVVQVSLIAAIVSVGLVGNFLLGLTICLSPRLRSKSINIFILNLCIANFLNLFLVAPSQVTNGLTEFYLLPSYACKLLSMGQIIFFVVPMLTLVVISLDRLLAIKYPFRDTVYTWKALLVCLVIWAIGIGMSIDKFIVRHYSLVHYDDFDVTMCYDSNEKGNYQIEDDSKYWLKERIYWFSVVTVCFLLPFLGMLIFYVGILFRIKRIAKNITVHDQSHNRNVLTVAVMVIVVIISTLMCWMPMVIFWFRKYSKPTQHDLGPNGTPKLTTKIELDPLYVAAQFCIFVHCSIQPIIYYATGSKFRKEARKIFSFARNGKGDFPVVEALLNQHARMMDLSVEKTFHKTEDGANSTDEVDSGPEDGNNNDDNNNSSRSSSSNNNSSSSSSNNNNNGLLTPSPAKFSQISILALPPLDRKLSIRSLGIADVTQMMTELQKNENIFKENRKEEGASDRIMDDKENRKISNKSTLSDKSEGRYRKTSLMKMDIDRKISNKSTLSDKTEKRSRKTSLLKMDIDPGDTPSGSPATRRKSHVSFFNVVPGNNWK